MLYTLHDVVNKLKNRAENDKQDEEGAGFNGTVVKQCETEEEMDANEDESDVGKGNGEFHGESSFMIFHG